MKKYLLLFLALLSINFSVMAAPGDTTWVQANNTQLTWYNNYDTTITFPSPGTSYRKIYMTFTLGKYTCPGYTYGTGSVPWCGDWDYTVQNYLMTPGGDTLEIGRFITPYANNLAPRTPYTWTQRYTYDVTDYAQKLQGPATMRIHYSGYSGGFTANIKFAFIEGTPDRTVTGIQKLWDGSYSYGDTTHSDSNVINTHFTPVTAVVPAGTQSTDLKFTVTGHGSDPNNCCEFASHNYQVMLNGASVATKTVWRDNCGLNELYPQSGTWLIERANWCPGAMVYSNYHVLPGITSGSFNIGLQFDPYISNGAGSYTTFGTLIYYGAINKTRDASIEEIIAPSNNENYFRENPIVGPPILHVRNSGAATIDSIQFQYGLKDSAMQTYTWIGTLAPLQDTEISLAPLLNLNTIAGISGTYNFIANIVSVNGTADVDPTNDTMRSQFISAPKWPSSFKIIMETSNINEAADPAIAQTSWVIYDKSNNTIVMQRSNCSISTIYTDTVTLPTGSYQLAVYDSAYSDGNYYGLNWWALAGSGYSPGYIHVAKLTGPLINMNGYNYYGEYNNDFGQGFTQDFYVYNATTAVNNVNAAAVAVNVYPNPAKDLVSVEITGLPQVSGKIEIVDELGKVVSSKTCTSGSQQINVSKLSSGVYTVLFINNDSQNRLQTKLLLAK